SAAEVQIELLPAATAGAPAVAEAGFICSLTAGLKRPAPPSTRILCGSRRNVSQSVLVSGSAIRDRALDFELQCPRPLEISSSDSPSFVSRWFKRGRTALHDYLEVAVAIVTFESHGRRHIIDVNVENESHRIQRKCRHALILKRGANLHDRFKPRDGSVKVANPQMYMIESHGFVSASEKPLSKVYEELN